MLNFKTVLIAFGLLCLFIFLIARQTDSRLTAAPAVNAHWSGKDMVLPVGKEYAAFFCHPKKGNGAQSECKRCKHHMRTISRRSSWILLSAEGLL